MTENAQTERVAPAEIKRGDVVFCSAAAADKMTVEYWTDGEIEVRGADKDGDVFAKRIPARHFFGDGGKRQVSRGMDDYLTRLITDSA
ncbi:hypothetical protein KN248_002485 [Mycobacterium paraintracellulare]|uniref:hypothetical protein n=1 Tax=Mycobacterium paraintracellulare TaxID=1138383 RepID=UPI0019157798|nr:hypothetical protein [Mycobacterium paraintracellulare]WVL48995.1 hypothetical protein KN248_002485 [Mycobacterium paraintracellulare]